MKGIQILEAEQIEDFAKGYKTFKDKGWSEQETINVLRLMTAVGTTKTDIQDVRTELKDTKGELIKWMSGLTAGIVVSVIAMGTIAITIFLTR